MYIIDKLNNITISAKKSTFLPNDAEKYNWNMYILQKKKCTRNGVMSLEK